MDNNVIYIETESGLKRVMNNLKLYAKLLLKFKEDPAINDLNAALTAGDLEKAKSAVHALKGLSANLSLIELNRQSVGLEEQIKAQSVNPNQVDAVNNVYNQTIIEMDKVINQYV